MVPPDVQREPCVAFRGQIVHCIALYCRHNFLWAHSVYASRAFPHYLSRSPDSEMRPEDIEADGCLIPVLDLLNHNPWARMTWFRDEGALRFITGEDTAVRPTGMMASPSPSSASSSSDWHPALLYRKGARS